LRFSLLWRRMVIQRYAKVLAMQVEGLKRFEQHSLLLHFQG
jgi:hypothetical protein